MSEYYGSKSIFSINKHRIAFICTLIKLVVFPCHLLPCYSCTTLSWWQVNKLCPSPSKHWYFDCPTDPKLFTPGPLGVSLTTKQAMLRDVGSRDQTFISTVRQIRTRLVELAGNTWPPPRELLYCWRLTQILSSKLQKFVFSVIYIKKVYILGTYTVEPFPFSQNLHIY